MIFSAPLDSVLLAQERSEQLGRLSFEEGSPGVAFQAEAARLLAGSDSAWARPIRGTPRSLSAVDADALSRYRSAHYRRNEAVQAVVGPPGSAIDSARTNSTRVARDTMPRRAWRAGTRVAEFRDVTSTWLRVAYPLPSTTPCTVAEMIADLVESELSPSPPDPDLYAVTVELLDAPGGTVLVVDAAVFPEAADRWEKKITATVGALAAEPMDPDFFTWRRRRFRTKRLLKESTPETEARRMAVDLLREGNVRELDSEIWGLDAGAVHRAAAGLGAPRVLRFGPDLGEARRLP